MEDGKLKTLAENCQVACKVVNEFVKSLEEVNLAYKDYALNVNMPKTNGDKAKSLILNLKVA